MFSLCNRSSSLYPNPCPRDLLFIGTYLDSFLLHHDGNSSSFFFFFVFFLLFLGLLPPHMEVPRLGAESELQPPAYARATATRVPSRICNLHHSSWQRRIVNPLSKGRDRTRNLMVPSRIR